MGRVGCCMLRYVFSRRYLQTYALKGQTGDLAKGARNGYESRGVITRKPDKAALNGYDSGGNKKRHQSFLLDLSFPGYFISRDRRSMAMNRS